MIDYHVHVSGMPIIDKYKPLVKDELRKSLNETGVKAFLGIISPGSLYNQEEVTGFPKPYHFFDIDGKGLAIVNELGGAPAVSLRLDTIGLDDILKRMQKKGIDLVKLFYHGEPGLEDFVKKVNDISVKAMLIHTPSDFKLIEPVYELVSHKDIELILGHGCYKSKDLINKVRDYGFYVDTSINPLERIEYWIANGGEDNLVFGSDFPCPLKGKELDWNAQLRELDKISEIKTILNKRVVRV